MHSADMVKAPSSLSTIIHTKLRGGQTQVRGGATSSSARTRIDQVWNAPMASIGVCRNWEELVLATDINS